jgi:hypothetical protein
MSAHSTAAPSDFSFQNFSISAFQLLPFPRHRKTFQVPVAAMQWNQFTGIIHRFSTMSTWF